MKGTRPLNNDEIRRVSVTFIGTFEIRNRGLFMLGVSTGRRISELLSLQIADVYQNGKPVADLRAIVQKSDLPNFRETDTLNKSSLGWHCYETVTNTVLCQPPTIAKWIRGWWLEYPNNSIRLYEILSEKKECFV